MSDYNNQQEENNISGIPNSSDILFLKRRLFLKASIDNEVTSNAYDIPFNEEKMI